ncbi:uncharacterized protein LOC126479488 [Schistocerca serialis cubense]|uniref:uncharacterized protein LOC126479488 n=1 Tax=Schistocerca serialis cubense TaxID=2023355 RepID=UPI00214E73EE|nr:uncharacterized protein LOC126479488 [Schistocerca serialis cubense]
MAFHINFSSDIMKSDNKVQYIPCYIAKNGTANVSKYFEPYVKTDANENVLRASFRGRPLVGDKLELPKQYSGIVMQEQKQPLTESTERTAHVTHAFKSIVYWNWAKQPSKNDAFVSMLDWIDIAEVLHTSD